MSRPWGEEQRDISRGEHVLNPGEKVEAVIESLSSIQMSLCHPRASFPFPTTASSFPLSRRLLSPSEIRSGDRRRRRRRCQNGATKEDFVGGRGCRRIPRRGNGKQIAPSPSAVTPISTSDSDCNHCAKGLPRRDAPYIRPSVGSVLRINKLA